ncbi:PG0541 family transporter-associated protein [Desulfonatronovibrio magnus]|uniref:PG0541 family transporter-associated protein n=1 Tax=Desulfonatronovibrio magnus TaxID=698827 RepID=UPI000698A700|nr:PG0541 family transporter-associated protein [Desulfonatronovibrio magnus]
MKFVHISFRFEYTDNIDALLDKHRIDDYVRYPMVEGKGQDGKHMGTQVFPGNFTVIQARVEPDQFPGLMSDLQEFRSSKSSHQHLRVMVLPVEDSLGF